MRDAATEPPYVSAVEVRTIPRMRVARCQVVVEAVALWSQVDALRRAAAGTGVAVAGVPIVVFEDTGGLQMDAGLDGVRVRAELRVPVSDLSAPLPATTELPAVEFVRLDRQRAACMTYAGPPGVALREAVQALLVWVAQAGEARADRCHHHVYMPNAEPRAITVEIRIPLD